MKKIISCTIFAVLIVAATAAALLFGHTKTPFTLPENTPVIAAEFRVALESEAALDANILTAQLDTLKMQEQGINTLLLNFEEPQILLSAETNKEYIKCIFAELESRGLQGIIKLNLSDVKDEELQNILKAIYKKYPVAYVALENFSPTSETSLAELKNKLKCDKNGIKLLKVINTEIFESLETEYDGVIWENANSDDYCEFKLNEPNKLALLTYKSETLLSDIRYLVNYKQLDGAIMYGVDMETPPLSSYIYFEQLTKKPVFNFEVNDVFQVTYPTKDVTTWYSGIFVTGTGAKDEEVFINDIAYKAAKDGTFGVYIQLSAGDNYLTVSNGEEERSFVVTRKVSSGSGGSSKIYWDNSARLEYGRVVKTVNALTSVLSSPIDDSSIITGLPAGTELIVQKSEKITKNGKYTWAYKLSNGGYVLSSQVEVLNAVTEDYVTPAKLKKGEKAYDKINLKYADTYTAPVIKAAEYSPEEDDGKLTLLMTGKPAVFSRFAENSLELLFLDCSAEDFKLPKGALYDEISIQNTSRGAMLKIQSANSSIYGFDVETSEAGAEIFLKSKPIITETDKPLEGIVVMLDPGHGDTDSGALGIAYPNGPTEKDLNLAVGLLTKELLKTYGAEVIMTREDDSFPTLEDRRSAISEHKPDLFISIHHNSMDYSYNSTKAVGSECYYFTWQSEKLAKSLCEEISTETQRHNRGAKNSYYYVTRSEVCPAVLMEYSFLINADEYSKTYTDEMLFRAALGTTEAIIKALK